MAKQKQTDLEDSDFDELTNEEGGYDAYETAGDNNDEAFMPNAAEINKEPSIPDAGIDEFEDFNIDEAESVINSIKSEDIDDFNDKMNYDNFIVLNKRDVTSFCYAVEPMIKTSVDDYGKCVNINPIDTTTVELTYVNTPNKLTMKVANKSGKTVRPFSILVSNLKKLINNAYASIVFVEEDGELNIAVCDSLLYLETKPLDQDLFKIDRMDTPSYMDREVSIYTFKKIAAMLASSDRASEKVIVIKNDFAHFNTGFFAAKSKSPFGKSDDFILYKMVTEVLTLLSTISKVELRYGIYEDKIVVSCDGFIYCELQISSGERVSEFYSPTTENSLKFDASIVIVNDSLLRLVQITKSLDYLSDIINLKVNDSKISLTIKNTNQTKFSVYDFDIIEGGPERMGDMNMSCQVLLTFLGITGQNIKYSYTEEGLGIVNDFGTFLLRRTS